jgi:hypothetical protein
MVEHVNPVTTDEDSLFTKPEKAGVIDGTLAPNKTVGELAVTVSNAFEILNTYASEIAFA